MRLVGYVRVSQVAGREGERFISPSVQREQIERYAQLRGHEIAEWIEDLDQSGGKRDRPGWQQALRLVEQHQVDGLACARLDRFARSVLDGREGLERVNRTGGTLVLVAEGLDTSTPIGKAMFTILLAFAELELDRVRENFQIARDRAIARGVPVAPHVKLGYRKTADGRLEPDPETAPLVREIFQRRAAGESWRSICDHVDQHTGGSWTITTLMGVVASRVYLGEIRHGAAVNTAAHEPLVTRKEWEQAQQAQLLRPSRRHGSLLAGIVRCAGCGYAMSREGAGKRPYWYYACRKRHAGGACPEPTKITGPTVDGHVEELFLARVGALVPAAVAESAEGQLDRALAAVEIAEAEVAAYRDANLVSVIGADAFRDGLEVRARDVDAARVEVAQLRRSLPALVEPARLVEVWGGLELEERRQILAAAIDAVFVKRAHLGRRGTPVEDRVAVLWAGEGPELLPGRGVVELRPFVF